jgi:hypothetical protein
MNDKTSPMDFTTLLGPIFIALGPLFLVWGCDGGVGNGQPDDGVADEGVAQDADLDTAEDDAPDLCAAGCGPGQVCVGGTCIDLPPACPCPLESYCDLATNTCVIGCTADEQCDAGRFCDVPQRTCRPGCRVDGDCPAAESCVDHACVNDCPDCDDRDPCTVDGCDHGSCTHVAGNDGAACPDDGDPCTGEACAGGVCTHPAAGDGGACADEGNPCTLDVCSGGACIHPAGTDGTACADDGSACTGDVCAGGACTHPPANEGGACADDGNACTTEICVTGSCTHPAAADNTACAADSSRFCLAGACEAPTYACVCCGGTYWDPVQMYENGTLWQDVEACQCASTTTLNYGLDGWWHMATCSNCIELGDDITVCW